MTTVLCPLERPNTGWIVAAVESAFLRYGPPKHIITDQEGVFASDAVRGLLSQWGIKRRFGAVGKYGSIAVTERAILTLKQERLRRVAVIRGVAMGHPSWRHLATPLPLGRAGVRKHPMPVPPGHTDHRIPAGCVA